MSANPTTDGRGAEHDDTGDAASGNILRVALVAALGGLLYGYDTGVISGTLPQITEDYGIDSHGVLAELITALILAGAVVGALAMGYLSHRIGRKKSIVIVAAIFAVGVLLCAVSPNPTSLMISRFFLGLAVGGCTQTIPAYIGELAPHERRGSYVTFFNVAIGVGILTAAVVNLAFHDVPWEWKIAGAVVPAIVLLVAILAQPESPRWLVARDRSDEALDVLHRMRPTREAAADEVKDIERIHQVEVEKSADEGEWHAIFHEKWLRPAIFAGVMVAVFTQITGLEMMIYYTPTLLRQAGFADDVSLWVNVAVGVVYLTMTAAGKLFVDKIGRRSLMLWTLPPAAVCIAGFGIVMFVGGDHPSLPWALTFLLLFMFFQAGGIQVVGWLMGSELYPLQIRSAATSMHAMALWGSNLLITVTALSVVNALTPGGAMLVYAALNLVAWVVIYRRVPETKGRSLEEIEDSLREERFLPRS